MMNRRDFIKAALATASLSYLFTGSTFAQRSVTISAKQTFLQSGDALYELVQQYAALGFHRVGTDVDRHTNDWFSQILQNIGGEISMQPFSFTRFDGYSRVRISGKEVPSMPLYYEGIGNMSSSSPFVGSAVALRGDRTSAALQRLITSAQTSGARIAVIATQCELGELQVPNREPRLGSGLPVVLVPGRLGESLQKKSVDVLFSGKIVPGKSNNIIATFGDVSKKAIIIATPLSGWFQCAAERGTGIALALGLAQALAEQYPVIVIGSPGHELLHHIGLETLLKTNQFNPALIVHLGANVALTMRNKTDNTMVLAPGSNNPSMIPAIARGVSIRMDDARFKKIEPILLGAGLPALLNPKQWNGEGALWASAVNAPLMSFVGIGPQFHTPADVPEQVTSPQSLETVHQMLLNAIQKYMQA
ncbi:hypothetical protein [Serratia sp. FDAARGOS_506]|uniref:hypothetical protein n=1 Tax=Serratia sp. FDAARGOS_506 TaxID=2420306 RepID=UPI000F4FF7BC|nr:hypothetical protein [Serratia sp. FDAARGOS_506]AYZ33563.1 hypothetical protein EGY12_21630 [Serratia sp. FDAARGOS_506]